MTDISQFGTCPTPVSRNDHILLAHGGGGQLSADLLREVFMPAFSNPVLDRLEDQAQLPKPDGGIAFTTDAFVVEPVIFPGGDIGTLAVNGTVNDLAMGGAIPRYLSAAFILEEGLPIELLKTIVASMGRAAEQAGVQIVTGDTKVVNKGSGDQIFITTSGIGTLNPRYTLGVAEVRPGDHILLSGTIGEHGIAVLSCREGIGFEGDMASDCAALHDMVQELLRAAPNTHCMRDPTRGGLAAVLIEIAETASVGITIREKEIPLRPEVKGASEMLGLDPLHIANEGKLVAFVPPEEAEAALHALRNHPLGRSAVTIGEVSPESSGRVRMVTEIGSQRLITRPMGEPLPRIC